MHSDAFSSICEQSFSLAGAGSWVAALARLPDFWIHFDVIAADLNSDGYLKMSGRRFRIDPAPCHCRRWMFGLRGDFNPHWGVWEPYIYISFSPALVRFYCKARVRYIINLGEYEAKSIFVIYVGRCST